MARFESPSHGYNNTRPIQLPCCNVSDEEAPPYAMLQMTEQGEATFDNSPEPDKSLFVYVTKPTNSGGKCAINSGKTLGVEGETTSFGDCFFPATSFVWAMYEGDEDPGTPWITEMGPEDDDWNISKAGSGFFYTGIWDQENERVLVTGNGDVARTIEGLVKKVTEQDIEDGHALQEQLNTALVPAKDAQTDARSFKIKKWVKNLESSEDPRYDPDDGIYPRILQDQPPMDKFVWCVNRSVTLSALENAHVIVTLVNGEYTPVWVEDFCPI